jgi:lysophospholipase L1-like esterase
MAHMRLVAIGDSFTEGVGDELADGTPRGWADLVAGGMAVASGEPVEYANLAIRGRLLGPIVDEQLEPALALEPTVLTFNGGGNDMLRPRADIGRLRELTEHVITRCLQAGVQPLILSGGDPTDGLPLGDRIRRIGDQLTSTVTDLTAGHGVPFANNWADVELRQPYYWADDRLHLNTTGHKRVAARVLATLDVPFPSEWMSPIEAESAAPRPASNAAFYRQHVVPWIRRRLTGRSSGDGRKPKYPQWITVPPDMSVA